VSLLDKKLSLTSIKIPKGGNAYLNSDQAEKVYFIESGQVKLLTYSLDGKECLLCILTAGDTFGELCLAGAGQRQETAAAMIDTTLIGIPCASFFPHLVNHSLVEGYVQYLAMRVADQQQVIANLIMADSEYRLGETLLRLARQLGRQELGSKRIEQKITHEELAQMVGTTRPRVSKFMLKFRNLGLISISPKHSLLINEKKLAAYLAQSV
jgi:CRP/FNR family cyclic AMP-dependent transcriptional regulator